MSPERSVTYVSERTINHHLQQRRELKTDPHGFAPGALAPPARINIDALPSEECGDRLQNRHSNVTEKPGALPTS